MYVTFRRVRVTVVAVEKAINITYSECVFVALGIQHAIHMSHIVTCGLPHSTIFFQLSETRHVFRKKLLNTKCVFFIFSTNFA